jgi:hypothetical protein
MSVKLCALDGRVVKEPPLLAGIRRGSGSVVGRHSIAFAAPRSFNGSVPCLTGDIFVAATFARLRTGQTSRFLEDIHKHFPGQLSGLRVLVRWMVRGKNDLVIGQTVLDPMAKFVESTNFNQSPAL